MSQWEIVGFPAGNQNVAYLRQWQEIVGMSENARNLLGILMKYANEVYWDRTSDQTLGILFSMNSGNVRIRLLQDFPSVTTGNGEKLLGIHWEIWRIMQISCSGTKHLIRHQKYLPGFPSINTGNVVQDSYHVSAFPRACDHTLEIFSQYKYSVKFFHWHDSQVQNQNLTSRQ